jgi:hypothetical protein
MRKPNLRYHETGPLHRDFHRTTNGTIAYLRKTHGLRMLDAILRHVAQDVYRSIHEDLKRGDPEQLVKHWRHFFRREKGRITIRRKGTEIRMTVQECPAIAYLRLRGIAIDPAFCRQTVTVNNALAEGTPFTITTEVLGEGRCVQTIRRRPS